MIWGYLRAFQRLRFTDSGPHQGEDLHPGAEVQRSALVIHKRRLSKTVVVLCSEPSMSNHDRSTGPFGKRLGNKVE